MMARYNVGDLVQVHVDGRFSHMSSAARRWEFFKSTSSIVAYQGTPGMIVAHVTTHTYGRRRSGYYKLFSSRKAKACHYIVLCKGAYLLMTDMHVARIEDEAEDETEGQ